MQIDFVIAWVNGNDPEWQKEKNKYKTDVTQDASDARYRDWENLKYWFRSIELYAPWVRKIHFLTWGHIPEWLDTSNKKLNIVNHKDYIPKEYLPTFNSHTIELNMHRIKGLSEYFVYFNDDMFINNFVTEEDFFKNNLPRDTFALDAIYFAPDSAGSYNGNNLEIINKHFNKDKQFKLNKNKYWCKEYGAKNLYRTFVLNKWHWFSGFKYDHLPSSFLKSTIEEVWDKEFEILDATCKDKFRSKRNVNQWLFKYWQFASGNFYPRNYDFGLVFHLKEFPNKKLLKAIKYNEYHMICINDTIKTLDFEKHKKIIIKLFDKKFPKKSKYEL